MGLWFRKRASDSKRESADKLLRTAESLISEPSRTQEAERCLMGAIEGYRSLVERSKNDSELKLRLLRALLRQATLSAREQPAKAVVSGQEAVQLGRELLGGMPAAHPAFDAVVREVSEAMSTVAQIDDAGSRSTASERLLVEAAAVARRSAGVESRRALGAALHHLARHRHHHMGVKSPLRRSQVDIMRVLAPAERAFEIRLGLWVESHVVPAERWELANSALLLTDLLTAFRHQTDPSPVVRMGLASLRDARGDEVERLQRELTAALIARGAPVDPADAPVFPLANIASLQRGALVLLQLIGLLEELDRVSTLVSLWFPDLWRAQVGSAPVPSLDAALAELVNARLVTVRVCEGSERHYDVDYAVERWVRARVSDVMTRDVCLSVAQLWAQRFEADRGVPGANRVRSGIAAAVYARRGGEFEASLEVLEGQVMTVACERREWVPVAVHIQRSADASENHALIERCDRAIARLARAHFVEGYPDDALEAVAMGLEYSRGRELAPSYIAGWFELRMDLLYRIGRRQQVLDEFDSALRNIDALGAQLDPIERDPQLTPREWVLHHAVGAAKALNQWQLALDLNAKVQQALTDRNASGTTLAGQRMLDYAPLVELGRAEAADALLRECHAILKKGGDREGVAYVLGALGIVANRRGDTAAALDFKRRYLEAQYQMRQDLGGAAHAHDIYGNELAGSDETLAQAGLHWLAAAALYTLAGDRAASTAVLRKNAGAPRWLSDPPKTVGALTDALERDGFPFRSILRAATRDRAEEIVEELLNESQAAG